MPWHKEEVRGVMNPAMDFQNVGGFKSAVVVVNNLIARATTRWTLEESKLFMLAVSQIEMRDEKGWVRLRKKDVVSTLGMDPRDTSKLREKMANVRRKSEICFDGATADDWEDGFLITKTRSDRYSLYVMFDESYIPLLHYVKDQLFTKFEIQNIVELKHKSSYNLYLYLSSWHNANYAVNKRNINKADLPKVFNLKPGQYWRNFGTDQAKFDWAHFEKRCLHPAVEDIQSSPGCDMHIDKVRKIKDPANMRTVLGYTFEWHYENPDGTLKVRGERPALPDPNEILSIEQQNDIQYFMSHFEKLSERQLRELSDALGTNEWNDQPAWSVGELKQEMNQDCISPQLYVRIERMIGWDADGYGKFARIFGYEDPNLFIRDFGSVGLKHRLD